MRKIVHIDMDAFFAAVEQRDNPQLKGKPVIVGGSPDTRSVVCTCSYEARVFGVHSAMPSRTALKLCPNAIFITPRFDAYKEASSQIKEIFTQYTDLIEPISLDEAFLDVTDNKMHIPSATLVAQDIQSKILKKTNLTASAGVSYNKFLAKVASDFKKPNGLTIVEPEKALNFIAKLPIKRFFGIGKVTEEKMKKLGIYSGKELQQFPEYWLIEHFGKAGSYFYKASRGIDDRPVIADQTIKSIGKERTLPVDLVDSAQIFHILENLAILVEQALYQHNKKGLMITLKIKDCNFKTYTRSLSVVHPISRADEMMLYLKTLLPRTKTGSVPVRLLGITISSFIEQEPYGQLLLPFDYNTSTRLSC